MEATHSNGSVGILSVVLLSAGACAGPTTVMIPRYDEPARASSAEIAAEDRADLVEPGEVFRRQHSVGGRDYGLEAYAVGTRLVVTATVSVGLDDVLANGSVDDPLQGKVRWMVGGVEAEVRIDDLTDAGEFEVPVRSGSPDLLLRDHARVRVVDGTERREWRMVLEFPHTVMRENDGRLGLQFDDDPPRPPVGLPHDETIRCVFLRQN